MAVPLGMLVLAIVFFSAAWAHPTSHFAGVGGDPEQTIWFFAWIAHALGTGHNPLLSRLIDYPTGVNLMWNTAQPLAGLVLAPVTALAGPVIAYNVDVTLAVALTGWCSYLALFRWTGHRGGAVAGALLAEFSPYLVAESLGHANLLQIWTLPLALMALQDLVTGRRPPLRTGGLLGLVLSAQLLLSEEILLIELLALAVALAAAAWVYRDRVRAHIAPLARGLASCALVSLVLCGWPLVTQMWGPAQAPALGHSTADYVSDALGFLIPTTNQLAAPRLLVAQSSHFSGNPSEWVAYLGIPLILVMVAVAWRQWGQPLVRIATVVTVAMGLLSLGSQLHLRGHALPVPLPWALLTALPYLGDVLANRLMLVVDLGAALALALAVRSLCSHRRGLALALVAVVAVSLVSRPAPASTLGPLGPGLSTALATGGPTLLVPVGGPSTPSPLIWQVQAGFRSPLLGGYAMVPHPHTELNRITGSLTVADQSRGVAFPLGETAARARQALRRAGVTTIALVPAQLNPAASEPAIEAELDAIAQAPPQRSGGALIWRLGVRA